MFSTIPAEHDLKLVNGTSTTPTFDEMDGCLFPEEETT
jgi:hypothetical protein